jgi:hypothetical protein
MRIARRLMVMISHAGIGDTSLNSSDAGNGDSDFLLELGRFITLLASSRDGAFNGRELRKCPRNTLRHSRRKLGA